MESQIHLPYEPEAEPVSDAATASRRGYWWASRTATYGFLAALPLFLLYEALILWVNPTGPSQVRVGADLWIKQLLALFGGTGLFALGIPVLLIGIWIFVRDRKNRPPLKMKWFGWIVGESIIYAVLVALLVSTVVGLIFAMVPAGSPGLSADALPTSMMLVLSIGAGLYEELVFRVVLVGGMFWAFRQVVSRPWIAYVVAALIGAFLFSAVHYVGALGDVFTLPSFTFRFLFGLALNGVFLARGFGVAAWTHALYDVLVVTQILG
ncbi:MAG: CPBP family intramembrane metalloprotease [Bacteroidota bacterium]|nr:CPBP family intramembrane metalloprotease [Bacteroidota bacterium]